MSLAFARALFMAGVSSLAVCLAEVLEEVVMGVFRSGRRGFLVLAVAAVQNSTRQRHEV